MRPQKLFLVALLALHAGATWAAADTKSKALAACSAFGQQGNAATASLTAAELHLEALSPSGKPVSLVLPVNQSGEDDCKIFFNASSDLVAIVLDQREPTAAGIHIAVANVAEGQWAGNFTVEPQGSLTGPLSLVGFLEQTSSLVVRGTGTRSSDGADMTTVASLLLDVHGKTYGPPVARTVPGTPANQGPKYADATNNRMWFLSYPQFCPLRSVALTGPAKLGPVIDDGSSSGACDLPDAIAYPDAESVVMASTRSDRDWVWRVDLKDQATEKLALPQPRSPQGQQVRDIDHLSPDGQVFAIQRRRFSYGLFDNFRYQGDEIVVVQVHPLKLLGVIRPKHETSIKGFAVDHRNGKVMLLGYWDDQWQREQLNP